MFCTAGLLAVAVLPAGEATIAVGEQGLASVRVDGQELVLDGLPALSAQWPKDDGGSEPARSAAQKGAKAVVVPSAWEAATRTLRRDYGWAQLAVAYATPAAGRVDAVCTVRNTGTRPLRRVAIELARLRAPDLPGWTDSSACSAAEPAILGLKSSLWSGAWLEPPGALRPAMLGLGLDRPSEKQPEQTVRLRIGSGDGKIIVHDVQLDRPIAPGAEDAYAVSLRVGSPGTPLPALIGDAAAAHAKARPATLAWPDRRPILRTFFGGGLPKEQVIANAQDPAAAKRPTEVSAKFREQAVAKVNALIAAAKECDAQGVIMWDMEGGAFPHPTTYIGDPRLIREFNPEMDLLADELMRLCRDAGLPTGVCIRPSRVVFNAGKGTYVHSHSTEKDPCKELADKITYARERWGCRLFYIDTSVFWKPYPGEKEWKSALLPPDLWRELNRRFPDTLLIPEFASGSAYAHMACYGEADMGDWGTNPVLRAIWPDSFRVIVVEDADPWERFDRFVQTVRERNVLMTFGQGSGRVVAVKHIYATARLLDQGPPPAVAAAAPAARITLLGAADEAVRFHAARALGEQPAPGAGTALLRLAADAAAAWPLRRAAVVALRTNPLPEADVPALLALCLDPGANLSIDAGRALAAGGAPAHRVLAAALREAAAKDPGKARQPPFALLAAAAGGSAAPELAAVLREALAALPEKRQRERAAAVEALGRLRDAAAAPLIVPLMESWAGGWQKTCVEAIARIGEEASLARAKALVETVRQTNKDQAYALDGALRAK